MGAYYEEYACTRRSENGYAYYHSSLGALNDRKPSFLANFGFLELVIFRIADRQKVNLSTQVEMLLPQGVPGLWARSVLVFLPAQYPSSPLLGKYARYTFQQ